MVGRELAARLLRQRAGKLRREVENSGCTEIQLAALKKQLHGLGSVFVIWLKGRLASELEAIARELDAK